VIAAQGVLDRLQAKLASCPIRKTPLPATAFSRSLDAKLADK
jgi:hypothetical protein